MAMNWDVLVQMSWPGWLVLGGLAYALVTAVLSVLAARVRDGRERHNVAVRAVEQRQSYRRSVQQARERVQQQQQQRKAKRAQSQPQPQPQSQQRAAA